MKLLSQLLSVPENSNLEPMSDLAEFCPLYCSLIEKVKQSEKQMNWALTASKLNAMNEKEMELVYVLILCHFYSENKTFLEKKKLTPYKGKLMDGNKGILYTITELPLKLQQIIYEFVLLIRG
jgi:hypothetical protein